MNEYDYLAKAKNKMSDEKYHDVISLCDKALKINKNLSEAYDFRANAKYELGEYDDAIDDFNELIKREPDEAEHYYDRSWAFCKMYDYENAIIDIGKAIELEPETSLYYYEKGRFEYWADRYIEAILDLTKGIELKPTESKYIMRGNCYMELEEYSSALSDFNSAVEIEPEYYHAYYRRGLLYKNMDQLDNAAKDFKMTIDLCPDHDRAMIRLGLIEIELGKKDVMKYFNKAIKVNPSGENYGYRVEARARLLRKFELTDKLSNNKKIDYLPNGKTRIYNERQAKDDIKDLNKAIALDPEDTLLYKMRIERFLYLEEYKNAIADYDFLIETNPEKHLNYALRAFCKERIGLYQEALDDCKKAVELNDGYADYIIFDTRGWANYKLGNFEKALTDFSQVLNIEENGETYYDRGLTNYKLKNFRCAYEDFKKALEFDPDIESDYDEKIPTSIKFAIKFMDVFSKDQSESVHPIGLCQIK